MSSPAGCCRRRRRWPSWRPPSWPSAARSTASRSWADTATPASTRWSATCARPSSPRSTAARRRSRRTSSRRRSVSRRARGELRQVTPPGRLDLEAVAVEGTLERRGGALAVEVGRELDTSAAPLLALEQPEHGAAQEHRVAGAGRERRPVPLMHVACDRWAEEPRLPGQPGGRALAEPGPAQVAAEAAWIEGR